MTHDNLNPNQKNLIHVYIDHATEKITKHRFCPPCAYPERLRDGKVRKEKKSTKYVGEVTHQYVDNEINKNTAAAVAKLKRQQAAAEKKRIIEEKKATKAALDKQ